MKRIWCIVTYSPALQIYNYIIHTLHFFGPFLINLISSLLLITTKTRQQANLHKQRPYKVILREQFRQHKNLLTAPIVLVLLSIPRLIIIFVSKCMESANDSWLFLVGYFISLIPAITTFIIFVLPSTAYKQAFDKALNRYRNMMKIRL